jgi:hypothetical protein
LALFPVSGLDLISYNLSFVFAFYSQQLPSLPDLGTSELNVSAFVQLVSSDFHFVYLSFSTSRPFPFDFAPLSEFSFPFGFFGFAPLSSFSFPLLFGFFGFAFHFNHVFFFNFLFVHSFSFNSAAIQNPDIAFHVFHTLP